MGVTLNRKKVDIVSHRRCLYGNWGEEEGSGGWGMSLVDFKKCLCCMTFQGSMSRYESKKYSSCPEIFKLPCCFRGPYTCTCVCELPVWHCCIIYNDAMAVEVEDS